MPANIATVRVAMMASVLAAFLALGGRKFGTPLLTASTPVSAVHPEANDRRTTPTSTRPLRDVFVAVTVRWADSAVGAEPNAVRARPTMIMANTAIRNP